MGFAIVLNDGGRVVGVVWDDEHATFPRTRIQSTRPASGACPSSALTSGQDLDIVQRKPESTLYTNSKKRRCTERREPVLVSVCGKSYEYIAEQALETYDFVFAKRSQAQAVRKVIPNNHLLEF